MAKCYLTAQVLRMFLDYDPETGNFVRLRNSGTSKVGDIAGWREPNGYIKLSIDGRKYYAHRCAILFVTGFWPEANIDHIDGNKGNNAYRNLRCGTQQLNLQNLRKPKSNNKTGYLGVCFHKKANKYVAECKDNNGKRHYLGLFHTAEEAFEAYIQAKRVLQVGCTI